MKGKVISNKLVFIFLTSFFVTLFVITGCRTSTNENVLERNKNLVRQMNDVVRNKGDLDRMDEFFRLTSSAISSPVDPN